MKTRLAALLSQLAPCVLILGCALPMLGQPVEPKAGTWKAGIISSGKDFRVPPPPDAGTTAGELRSLPDAVAEPNPTMPDPVRFWTQDATAAQGSELISSTARASPAVLSQ